MEGDHVGPDRTFLTWCLQQPGIPHCKLTTWRPEFLVISPPKTGSTWLADNLRCHPQIFVPAIKEIKYFSSLYKWLDLDWYLTHFEPGAGRVKGEASPSYGLLPEERIRLLRQLWPDVKLILLMRDPVARAWSHVKHNHRNREAYFASSTTDFHAVTPGQWCGSCAHDWPLASGDYLGQLRRWLTVFPRQQLYLGFYETIASRPETLLRELFAFLGVNPEVDLSSFPVSQRINPGQAGELPPAVEPFLRQLLGERSRELAAFLREQWGLETPPEWRTTLEPVDGSAEKHQAGSFSRPGVVFRRELDNRFVARVLELEEGFPSACRSILNGHEGYDIVLFRGRLYALHQTLGPVWLPGVPEAELRRLQDEGRCFVAPSLAEVKEHVTRHVFHRAQTELQEARTQLARLEERLGEACEAIRKIEADPSRLYPWYAFVVEILRRFWRRCCSVPAALWPRQAPRPVPPARDVAPSEPGPVSYWTTATPEEAHTPTETAA